MNSAEQRREDYRRRAKTKWVKEHGDDIEIDDDADVSPRSDGEFGAFVHAWIWVPIDTPMEDEDEPSDADLDVGDRQQRENQDLRDAGRGHLVRR